MNKNDKSCVCEIPTGADTCDFCKKPVLKSKKIEPLGEELPTIAYFECMKKIRDKINEIIAHNEGR